MKVFVVMFGNENVAEQQDDSCKKYRLLHIMCGYQCDKAVNKNDTQ